jgi:hypothetical protein
MYITKIDDLYKLWTNDRKLLASSKSRYEIQYILFKYIDNKEVYECKCLLCLYKLLHLEK